METGKLSESVLKRSVLRQIKTKNSFVKSGAAVGEDCAIFGFADTQEIVTCMQEAVLMTDEEALGSDLYGKVSLPHALIKCANNLAAGGAVCRAVLMGLLLPEGCEESSLKGLMQQAQEWCAENGVEIAGGQTLVTRAVQAPAVMLTGYGIRQGQPFIGPVRPGQDIVISKWVGLEGTAYLARRCTEKLLARYPAYFIEEASDFGRYLSVIPEAATAIESGVCGMHDISKGGVFGALWEMAEKAGVGLKIDLKKIPLRQETVEVCEVCEVNPYEMLSGGSLIMIAPDGERLAEALREKGIPAAVVGHTTEGRERILCNEDEVRYMDRPRRDSLYEYISSR